MQLKKHRGVAAVDATDLFLYPLKTSENQRLFEQIKAGGCFDWDSRDSKNVKRFQNTHDVKSQTFKWICSRLIPSTFQFVTRRSNTTFKTMEIIVHFTVVLFILTKCSNESLMLLIRSCEKKPECNKELRRWTLNDLLCIYIFLSGFSFMNTGDS